MRAKKLTDFLYEDYVSYDIAKILESKGFGEDEGIYKVSIKLSDDIEKVKESFATGMAMIVYDSIHGETDFNKLDDADKNEFTRIYTDMLYKGE